MSLYKYMSQEGVMRLLSSWHLRITPPAEFNDPFELQPPVDDYFTPSLLASILSEKDIPEMVASQMEKELCAQFGAFLSSDEIHLVAKTLIVPGPTAEKRLFKRLSRFPGFKRAFKSLQRQAQSELPHRMKAAQAAMLESLPAFNSAFRRAMTDSLPTKLGVLCLSGNANQPLMWAHYADSHRGAMIEFDNAHATFNRRRGSADEFGHLRPVVYSELRPALTGAAIDADLGFEVFALRKV